MSAVRMTPRGRARMRLLLLVCGVVALLTAFATAIRAEGAPWAVQIAIYEVGAGAAALLWALGTGRRGSTSMAEGPTRQAAGGATALLPWIVLSGFLLLGALFGLAHWSDILGHFQTLGTRGERRGLAQLLGGFFWGGVIASAVLVQWLRSERHTATPRGAQAETDTTQRKDGGMESMRESPDHSPIRDMAPSAGPAADAPHHKRAVLADTEYWTFRTKAVLWGATTLLGLIGTVFMAGVQTAPTYALAAGGLLGIAGALGVWAVRMSFPSARAWSPWWALGWLVACSGIGCVVALLV